MRHPRATAIRHDPKRTSLLRPTDARAAWERYRWRRELGAVGSRHASRPSGRRCATSGASPNDVAPEIAGALEAQGLHPAEQISLCWLHRRRAESDAGNAIKLPPRYASARPRSSRRWRRFRRPPTRQSVAPPPRRCSRKILPSARVAQFIPSLRTWPRSNYACAWRREGNEAFIVGDYRGEYWR